MIFGLVSLAQTIAKKFEAMIPEKLELNPEYNLRPTSDMLFLSTAKPKEFTRCRFGMTPSWSKNELLLFEAPVENPKKQKQDRSVKMDIILSQNFRNPIRSQRGLLPVDYFIVESDEGKPYLVFMKDKKRPIGVACVWDAWKKEIVDDLVYGFAVVTVPVFGALSKIGITQLPLILTEYHYKKWLRKDAHLSEITSLLEPLDEKYLDAYPVSNDILTNTGNERRLIDPIGETLLQDAISLSKIERHGHKKSKGIEENPEWGERYRALK